VRTGRVPSDDNTSKIISEPEAGRVPLSLGDDAGEGAARHAGQRGDRLAVFGINVLIL
jgi:hypothetical protein